MKKLMILIWVFTAFSCGNSIKKPIDTASSVPPSEISLGGIIAEMKDSSRVTNMDNEGQRPDFISQINELITQAEVLKSKRKSLIQPAFLNPWNELNSQFIENLENLNSDEIDHWITLNDSLLLYAEDVRFADALERTVYNNLGKYRFTDKQLKSFFYARRYDRIYLNIYGSSSMQYEHTTGGSVRLVQSTDYPYNDRITLKVELQDKRFLDLFIRIPEWANFASVTVKGVKYPVTPGQFAEVSRMWKNGDKVDIIIGSQPYSIERANPTKSFALVYGSLMLTYPKAGSDSLIYSGDDPVNDLRYVSPPGEMPTFTFTGIPDTTIVLQPYFALQNNQLRTAWINQ